MKLQQIEEIATRKVPIWQPALLVALLLAGYIAIPLLPKSSPVPEKKNTSLGKTLGVSDIKQTIETGVTKVGKPLANTLQKEAEKVLGIAQDAVKETVQSVASQGASQAKEFVLDNTLGKLLQTVNSLPVDQQDYVKKAICK